MRVTRDELETNFCASFSTRTSFNLSEVFRENIFQQNKIRFSICRSACCLDDWNAKWVNKSYKMVKKCLNSLCSENWKKRENNPLNTRSFFKCCFECTRSVNLFHFFAAVRLNIPFERLAVKQFTGRGQYVKWNRILTSPLKNYAIVWGVGKLATGQREKNPSLGENW